MAARDGRGIWMMLSRGLVALDPIPGLAMALDRKGGPAPNFGVHRRGDMVGGTYSLVLDEKVANPGEKTPGESPGTGAAEMALAPGGFHRVRLYARGGGSGVYAGGRTVLRYVDLVHPSAGGEGLWSTEGSCRFRTVVIGPPRSAIPDATLAWSVICRRHFFRNLHKRVLRFAEGFAIVRLD